jgi:serine/threonine-protein kinase HipA
MKQNKLTIFYKNIFCGNLTKLGDDSFEFIYCEDYCKSNFPSISLTLPKEKVEFQSPFLFPFFDGLIPEGWLLSLATNKLRLNVNKDRFELLSALCFQTIGAVHVGEKSRKNISSNGQLSHSQTNKIKFERCLICYDLLKDEHNHVYHNTCMEKKFGKEIFPLVQLDQELIDELALNNINESKSITGVQKKISLDLNEDMTTATKTHRLTITNLWGRYIFKPPSQAPHLPENEHLCILLAESLGIQVEKAALIPMNDGKIGLIARRFDRGDKNEEYHQEDFCQILERSSNLKYTGSYQQIGKILKNAATSPGNDCYRLLELVIFNFIIGNVDAHLKNFSLCYENVNGANISLSPAYDILSTDLFIADDEQTALAINAKKNKLKLDDFKQLAEALGVNEKVFKNIIQSLNKIQPRWSHLIDNSFLTSDKKRQFKEMIKHKLIFFSKGTS